MGSSIRSFFFVLREGANRKNCREEARWTSERRLIRENYKIKSATHRDEVQGKGFARVSKPDDQDRGTIKGGHSCICKSPSSGEGHDDIPSGRVKRSGNGKGTRGEKDAEGKKSTRRGLFGKPEKRPTKSGIAWEGGWGGVQGIRTSSKTGITSATWVTTKLRSFAKGKRIRKSLKARDAGGRKLNESD